MPQDVRPRIVKKSELAQPIIATWQARQAAVRIDILELVGYASQGNEIFATRCTKGIPRAAFYLGPVIQGGEVALIFEHESFAEVRVGSPIPIFELEFEEI